MSRTEPVEVTPRVLRGWPLPEPGSSKYARGRVVVVGGATRTPGAVRLAGLAALRVGAGQLRLAVAEPAAVPLAVVTPEAAVAGLACDPDGSVLPDDLPGLADWFGSADAVVLGPGLDNPELVGAVVERVLPLLGEETRLVADAFVLGVLPDLAGLPERLQGRTVLTPNEEEAGRLLGRELREDTVGEVLEIADRYGAVIACQDVIAGPDGDVWRVGAGNPGLATSGSGDLVAGVVGGFLARGAEPAQAACWAKYLHACAGDRLAARIGRLGFLPSDVLTELPSVLAELD